MPLESRKLLLRSQLVTLPTSMKIFLPGECQILPFDAQENFPLQIRSARIQ
jgi:hypothetical protein